MNSEDNAGKSALVTIAFTPCSAAAFEVSMDLIFAWAWGLRNTAPVNMPALKVSAPNFARPVTLSTPSGRIGRVPTHFNSFPLPLDINYSPCSNPCLTVVALFENLPAQCLRSKSFSSIENGLVIKRRAHCGPRIGVRDCKTVIQDSVADKRVVLPFLTKRG